MALPQVLVGTEAGFGIVGDYAPLVKLKYHVCPLRGAGG
jgi:hypothetical protein